MLRNLPKMTLAVGCLLLTMTAAFASPVGFFSDELDADLYDCALVLHTSPKITPTSTVQVSLEWVDVKNYTQVVVGKGQILINTVKKGVKTPSARVTVNLPANGTYPLTISRRGGWMGLLHDQELLFRGEVPRQTGNEAGFEAGAGWTVSNVSIQRLEPVVFADNFMRTADEPGAWTVQTGQWGLQSAWDLDPKGNAQKFNSVVYAQNPFSWSGRNPGGSAICATGKPFWEDYTFSAAVHPNKGGAVGLLVNMTDANSGLLVRWSPSNDTTARGNKLTLYRMTNGALTQLAESKGGYIPDQWYDVAVTASLDGVSVAIDRLPRISVKNVTPWRGGVGLYAEGETGATFDDVTVYGRTLKKDLIAENIQTQVNQRFRDDTHGMQEWSAYNRDWVTPPGTYNYHVNRLDFFGDHWITCTVRPYDAKSGQLVLSLNANGAEINSGYRAVIGLNPDTNKINYTLFRDTTQLATATGNPLTPNVEYTFRFSRNSTKLQLEQDGEPIVQVADVKSPTGLRPAYRAEGCFAFVRDVIVLGRNMRDYTFADAPVDWMSTGTWMPTTRWSCAPQWSFLAGWSRGYAMLSYKDRVVGDQTFETFVGLKMEYPRERDIYDNRYRDLGISICSDGVNPLTGYSGAWLVPMPGEFTSMPDGRKVARKRTILYRNGVEVSGVDVAPYEMPERGIDHRNWFELALHKRGDTVELWVRDKPVLTYKDPKPLDGGVPGLWTYDNGFSVARARLMYANTPEPRTDSHVILEEPWYPEWAEVGKTLSLHFEDSWSTAGKPLTFKITPKLVPDGEKNTPTIDEMKVGFNPSRIGEYWYQITASDGSVTSAPYHLAMKTFDPSIKRDDSHTLLLYRFDEGKGDVVKDHAAIGPPADIMTKTANTTWLPGQGVTLRGANPMMTKTGVPKLMAIAKNRACTIETWVSTDTIYTPTGWAGCILAWENTLDKRNFAFGHNTQNLITTPYGGALTSGDPKSLSSWGFRTGLNHWVSTWDGTTTTQYRNGELMSAGAIDWGTANWDPNSVILLGNQSTDLQRNYLGTYYLVAIHDRCLTADEVKHHFEAGPGAR